MKLQAFILVVGLVASPVFAEPAAQIVTKEVENTKAPIENNPSYWGLTNEQWKRYTNYMAAEGRYFYKDLDPVFISGLIAQSDDERKQLAELYAKQEFERAKKLIAFNDDFEIAANRLYGHLEKISLQKLYAKYGSGILPPISVPVQTGDHIVLFVKRNCRPCQTEASKRYAALQDYPDGVKLDIYFVDSPSDVDIQRWAHQQNISVDAVRQRTVTLNRDNSRYKEYGSPTLPTTYLLRNHQIIGSL